MKWLKEIQDDHPMMGEVRGKGLMVGVAFFKDKETKEPAKKEAGEVVMRCFRRGIALVTWSLGDQDDTAPHGNRGPD